MNKLYFKLMATNIKNGKRFYLPYILAGALIVTLFYNMSAIYSNEGLSHMPGSSYITMIMNLGTKVVIIFSFIFIFYTNSFIMKRRKKDIGIYNILGMEKKHIAMELFIETIVITITIILCGLITGILFNKFLMMFLYKLLGFETSIKFTISGMAACSSLIVFTILYSLTIIYNVMQVKLSNPVELLRGSNVGEKEPKTKILMAIMGFVCLGTGYYIAITTENPLAAFSLFFVAVILVIAGTYLLFTSGSIALLKILRNNKNYYYKKKHFISISGMIYRMKQNATGLANICILSTMVLVMVSTTVSMFVGEEDILKTRFQAEINISVYSDKLEDRTKLDKIVEDEIKNNGRKITNKSGHVSINIAGLMKGNELDTNDEDNTQYNYSDITFFEFIAKDDMENICNIDIGEIPENEIVIYSNYKYNEKELKLLGETFKIKESIETNDKFLSELAGIDSSLINSFYAVTNDYSGLEKVAIKLREKGNTDIYNYQLHIDIDGNSKEKKQCGNAVKETIQSKKSDETGYAAGIIEIRESERESFYSVYGGLFFLGVFLGIMFLMITVLIIFYKQISEGYEDRERFIIMEKVGMSKKDVKASIRSQIRTVFILPIAVAAVHVAAAFPMIKRLLVMLNMINYKLYTICTIITILIFALIYIVVFLLTSRTYYKIVGEENR